MLRYQSHVGTKCRVMNCSRLSLPDCYETTQSNRAWKSPQSAPRSLAITTHRLDSGQYNTRTDQRGKRRMAGMPTTCSSSRGSSRPTHVGLLSACITHSHVLTVCSHLGSLVSFPATGNNCLLYVADALVSNCSLSKCFDK